MFANYSGPGKQAAHILWGIRDLFSKYAYSSFKVETQEPIPEIFSTNPCYFSIKASEGRWGRFNEKKRLLKGFESSFVE